MANKTFVLCLLAVCVRPAGASILPETIATFQRTEVQSFTPPDRALWDEYGLKEAEKAQYTAGDKKLAVTAWRLQDSTGALGAFEWQRPADATASKYVKLGAVTGHAILLAHGNYLFSLEGDWQPVDLAAITEQLKNVDGSPLPDLMDYLPAQSLIPNSERYVLGPVGLEKFAPGIPASTAAFHLGAEVQLGRFHAPDGDLALAIFNYPTPQIAMQQLGEFSKIPGVMAKRAGPMVALVMSPNNADAAEKLLALIRYQPNITLSERVPTRRDNIGHLILTIFSLIGLLLVFCTIAGLGVGAFRAFLRRGRKPEELEPMIMLHLTDR